MADSPENTHISSMFASLAKHYDLANDILSLGLHRTWRHNALKYIIKRPRLNVLDICTGTGDWAFALQKKLTQPAQIVGLDVVPEMLEIANEKLKHLNIQSPVISFIQGDALSLPFDNNSFDLCTVAFGIRNTASPEKCIAELFRVLKTGGQVVVLEFGKPTRSFLGSFYSLYARYIIPFIGRLLTKDRGAYVYLQRSSFSFPSGQEFCDLLCQGGFTISHSSAHLGGVYYLYVATKP